MSFFLELKPSKAAQRRGPPSLAYCPGPSLSLLMDAHGPSSRGLPLTWLEAPGVHAGPLLGLCPALQCPRRSSSLTGASPEGDGSQGLGLVAVWWLWADSCVPSVPGWCLHSSAPVTPRTGAEQDPRLRGPHSPPVPAEAPRFPCWSVLVCPESVAKHPQPCVTARL